jgi:hypothetical protein
MPKCAPDLYQIVILSEAKDLLFAAEESRSFASLRMTTLKNHNSQDDNPKKSQTLRMTVSLISELTSPSASL